MKRREFIGLAGGAALAWPLAAGAAGPHRVSLRRLWGVLLVACVACRNRRGDVANGLIEGRDYVFEWRFAAGQYQRLPDQVIE